MEGADGNGTSYEYDAAGRLTRRTWARGVATDYAYDALGQLTNIDYSDDTPDVSFTYDRMGRQVEVTDALGTRTNLYDPTTLDLAAEQLPDGQVLARSYDRFGRPAGIALDVGYQVAYAYDDASRFMAITSAVNAVTTAVKYAYLAQSDLISGWTVKEPMRPPFLVGSRVYEPHRDLVSAVTVSGPTGIFAQYSYANDHLGRRVARGDRVDGMVVSNVFGYNDRSELDGAVMGTNQFGYQYDAIGNRRVAVANDRTVEYEANALNQYASVLPSAGTPAYDADGNMISDGILSYSWDAENRLVEVRSNAAVIVQNAYDYLGRRIRKATATETNTFLYDGWSLLREDLGAATPSSRFYVWGLDLSGTLQGAGGVGGLLCQVEGGDGSPSRPLFSFGDANGNVTGLVDTNGAVAAHYEYDPYGNLLAQSGDQSADNPFRFSSKYWDDALNLYYYGYRFYSPSLGRWINRDPIGELGGINVYGFVRNSPLGNLDKLGLSCVKVYTFRSGGMLAGSWKQAKTEEDVEVSYRNLRGELGAFGAPPTIMQFADKKNKCDIEVSVQIYLKPNLPILPTKGAHYFYLEHYPQSGTEYLGGGISWSTAPGKSPTRGSVLDHEKGHARAFFKYTLPCFEAAVESYCGKVLTASDQSAIEAALNNCRKNTAKNSAQEANYSERLHYDLNGYKRLFPTSMYAPEYLHADPTTASFTDEWVYE
jgi:RHS repeat-associated protein